MQASSILLLFLFVIGFGLIVGRLARVLHIPDIVLFLLLGVLIGPGILGAINIPATTGLSQALLTFGAVFMLYEGGRELHVKVLREIWLTLTLLSTVGVLITAAAMGVAIHYIFGVQWLLSFLVAATIAPTDPATIIPLFQQVRLNPRVSHLAQSESAFNDATGAVFIFLLVAIVQHGTVNMGGSLVQFVEMVIGGLVVGVAVSGLFNYVASHGPRGFKLFGATEESSVISLIIILASYLLAQQFGFSGFMAVFVAGIVTGNKHTLGLETRGEAKAAHDYYFATSAMIVRMLIFVILGSHISIPLVISVLGPGLVAMAIFMFVARPLTVLPIMVADRGAKWRWRDIIFISWVRETGVVPAAMAGLISAMGLPGAGLVTSVVFIAILTTILIQGSTMATLARRLHLTEDAAPETA